MMCTKLLFIASSMFGLLLEPSLAFGVSRGIMRQQGAFGAVAVTSTFRRHAPLFSTAPSSDGDEKKEEKITLDKVAELIDTTFVNACMELAKGYVDVLKLLIVSIKSGYELGITPAVSVENVDAVENKAAGRALMAEEVRLRNTWIQIVYLVLSEANVATDDDAVKKSVDETVAATYADKIPILKRRQDSGEEFRFEDLIDTDPSDLVETAIMTQSLRVVWYTLVVLEEEERCNTEFARQDAPMKPQIPGAFD